MRSMIFCPASRPERAHKVWRFGPDAVIVDLEDAVTPERKDEARGHVQSIVGAAVRPWYVRINAVDTDLWQDDLRAALHPNLRGVIVPKVVAADMVRAVAAFLDAAPGGRARGMPVRIAPSIETAAGVAYVREIAQADPRVEFLTFGEGDFTFDIGIDWDSSSPVLTMARTQVVIESRLAGLAQPHDGVYPALDDREGLLASCRRARSMGFGSKHCIHPDQIVAIHEVFTPGDAEIARARRIVEAFDSAAGRGEGAIQVEGRFVDRPVYLRAQQVLASAGSPPEDTA